jgi:hypothetical protein
MPVDDPDDNPDYATHVDAGQTRPEDPQVSGIIVVSGIPGAGKSTVAPLLASRFGRGVHVEADVLHLMIKSGGRWPNEEPLSEGAAQLRLRGKNASLLARSFSEAGFVAVIDDIVIGERFNEYARDLDGCPWSLVQLLPSLDCVKARNRGRTSKDVYDQWAHLDSSARATPHGLRLDSSDLSPDETVESILADVWTVGLIG